jgi:dTMP kinase
VSRGLLVALEGIDGAGTSTQCARVAAALDALGHRVHPTREPSDGPIGKLLRAMLGGAHAPTDATTMALLFAADRADHIQREVEPALADGAIVLSDRWYHSSLAYQGSEADRGWVAELNRRARVPDQTFFLEVPAEVGAARRAAAGRPDELYDAIEVQRRVAHGYREVVAALAPREPIATLDGTRPPDDLTGEIVARIRALAEAR